MEATVLDSNTMTWVVVPALIFLARIVDVTIGTARVIFVSRGYKALAATTGFLKSLYGFWRLGRL